MEVNGYLQLFGYPNSSKKLVLCSAEEKKWEDDDRTIPLRHEQ